MIRPLTETLDRNEITNKNIRHQSDTICQNCNKPIIWQWLRPKQTKFIRNMNVKKCHVEQIPEPPPPDPCQLQRIKQKEKAGIIICPKPPIIQPPPAPSCLALCLERIKNPPVPPEPNFPIVCIVERQKTGTVRCDDILEATAAHPDLPWPGCPPPPLPPPPPEFDLCEEQRRREKKAECKERMKRYLE